MFNQLNFKIFTFITYITLVVVLKNYVFYKLIFQILLQLLNYEELIVRKKNIIKIYLCLKFSYFWEQYCNLLGNPEYVFENFIFNFFEKKCHSYYSNELFPYTICSEYFILHITFLLGFHSFLFWIFSFSCLEFLLVVMSERNMIYD